MKNWKYQTLRANFWKGSLPGQIRAIWQDHELRPDRLADFRAAIAAGDIHLRGLTKTNSRIWPRWARCSSNELMIPLGVLLGVLVICAAEIVWLLR